MATMETSIVLIDAAVTGAKQTECMENLLKQIKLDAAVPYITVYGTQASDSMYHGPIKSMKIDKVVETTKRKRVHGLHTFSYTGACDTLYVIIDGKWGESKFCDFRVYLEENSASFKFVKFYVLWNDYLKTSDKGMVEFSKNMRKRNLEMHNCIRHFIRARPFTTTLYACNHQRQFVIKPSCWHEAVKAPKPMPVKAPVLVAAPTPTFVAAPAPIRVAWTRPLPVPMPVEEEAPVPEPVVEEAPIPKPVWTAPVNAPRSIPYTHWWQPWQPTLMTQAMQDAIADPEMAEMMRVLVPPQS